MTGKLSSRPAAQDEEWPIGAYLWQGPLCAKEGSSVRLGPFHECSAKVAASPRLEPAACPWSVEGFRCSFRKIPCSDLQGIKAGTYWISAHLPELDWCYERRESGKFPVFSPVSGKLASQRRRVRSSLPSPPVSPVGTFFFSTQATAGMAQNAGLFGQLSEPRLPAGEPILGYFPSLFGPFL
jgi:hypothetical protein